MVNNKNRFDFVVLSKIYNIYLKNKLFYKNLFLLIK